MFALKLLIWWEIQMKQLLQFIHYISGQIFIPEELRNPSKRILHLSDTPSHIFRTVVKFASILKPDIIIHTGDMVDDVKLELYPGQAGKYKKWADSLLYSLSPHVKDKIIIVPGNHDRTDLLVMPQNAFIMDEGTVLNIDGVSIGLAHKFENLPAGCDYFLYGHDMIREEDSKYLNGIYRINIIDMNNSTVVRLPYPAGTDDWRMKRTKIGI